MRLRLTAQLAETVRLGRLGQIARVASFVASDHASFITGVELFVDGGAAQI